MSQALPLKRGTEQRVYKLVDYNTDEVNGSWYPEEIQELQTTNIASRNFNGGALYLTVLKNYSFVGKFDQTTTIRR